MTNIVGGTAASLEPGAGDEPPNSRLTLTVILWAAPMAAWASASVTRGSSLTKVPPARKVAGASDWVR